MSTSGVTCSSRLGSRSTTSPPAVRKALGRDDIWAVGLAMSAEGDTRIQFEQFVQAYQADYVTRGGKLVIDDPEIRRRLITTIDSYTAIYRKGCTPPDSMSWADINNNQAFLTGAVGVLPVEASTTIRARPSAGSMRPIGARGSDTEVAS
jgi:ABC-type glycerol-3-phosphate transport system substrate-binding protein